MRHEIGHGQRTTVAIATVLLLAASAGLAYAGIGLGEAPPDLSVILTGRQLPQPSVATTGSTDSTPPTPAAPSASTSPDAEKPSGDWTPQNPPDQAPSDSAATSDKDDDDDHEVVRPDVRDSDDEHKDSDSDSKKREGDKDGSGSKKD